jgi:ribosomal protein L40E
MSQESHIDLYKICRDCDAFFSTKCDKEQRCRECRTEHVRALNEPAGRHVGDMDFDGDNPATIRTRGMPRTPNEWDDQVRAYEDALS